MAAYFDQGRIISLADLVLELVGYDTNVRNVTLGGLPTGFKGMLPGGAGSPPMVSLRLDLQYLNSVERLGDGTVPIKLWLQNVLSLVGSVAAADPLREALAELEEKSTGAQPVVVAAPALVEKEKVLLRDAMVPLSFLSQGLDAAKSVAKLIVTRYENGTARMNGANPVVYLGTGWLIAPGLLMTNHHVFNARNDGEGAASDDDLRLQTTKTRVLFDYDGAGMAGNEVMPSELVAWDVKLDYALARVADGGRKPLTQAPRPLEKLEPNAAIAVNVIQHPDGNHKKFGIRNNLVAAVSQTELQYFTDTLNGSSGSPVLNDLWQVLGLHRGSTYVKGVKFQGQTLNYVNVGTQLSAILADLKARYAGKVQELGI
ncbi:trypsin-like peptidase domain-containing protein [Pyxidicoccus xibeiensis]|uniref:trypsin-like peptidase domain-containing protein n=1 Tax=Pyxidicoccus xibeiensis TaxID=2906759 RepID=UPI0020A79D46|nr:trypsin-like peptidase domain-containing protein [Pyxidicoccus xibeiensis]MCP3139787.1 serine protease [Pyxidicoccus xibeiensis]